MILKNVLVGNTFPFINDCITQDTYIMIYDLPPSQHQNDNPNILSSKSPTLLL